MAMNTDVDVSLLGDIHDKTGSLAQRVYLSLREAILALHLAPGAVLRKGDICEHLGVSRSPVSEAMARLSAEGLVEVVPQSFTRVSLFSMSEIRDGAFLREALELAAVERVAEIHTEDQLAQLKRNLRLQMLLVEDKDYTGFYQADNELHQLIMQFTGYNKLVSVASSACLQVDRARRLLLPNPGRATESYAEHQRIFDAIAAADPAASREAMRFHLSELVSRLEPLQKKQPELFDTD